MRVYCCVGGRILTQRRCVYNALALVFLWGLGIIAIVQLKYVTLEVHVSNLNKHQEANDEEFFVYKNPSLSENNFFEDIQKRIPNLPIAYGKKNLPMGFNGTCARFPNIFRLEFNNIYWQTLRTKNGTFQLYGAYLDNRANNRLGPTVRVLGMINRIQPTVLTYCQFWFNRKIKPVIVKSFEYKYIWFKEWGNYKQGIYQPYLISCVIPREYKHVVPESVSLVENACDSSTNNLRVAYNKPKQKKDFAVCVKGLDFYHDDLSARIVEWIELLNLLGADKIFFYKLQIHPNISKVLKYYEEKNQIEVTPISLPGGQPNAPFLQHLYLTKNIDQKRQNELIPYNDCFYKHMYEYKYIALLDIDEVIMPLNGSTWKELMEQVLQKAFKISKEEYASYDVRNVYFFDQFLHNHGWFKNIPKYMHMLQHVYRSKNFTKHGEYVKCFHNTEKVLILHNHYPLGCLGGVCKFYSIDTSDAQLQHYRADCVQTLKGCADLKKNSLISKTKPNEKNPEVCHLLGDYLEAIDKDFSKAAKVYKSNCDDYQYSKSCYKYGSYSLLGKGCKQDYSEAYKYFEQGCKLNHPESCLHQGLLATSKEEIKGVKPDILKGMKMLEKACSAANQNACYYLSGMYISGVRKPNVDKSNKDQDAFLVQKSMEKAFSYALKGCELGHIYSCVNLSQMYNRGDGVEKNVELAEKYRNMALEMQEEIQSAKTLEFGLGLKN
ncbi:hypothetical protein RN001_010879 [Aquatica leii]|uniref:Glycosyltransferase family 92 protein n=1 Tax=Aquatica leii TaxID=1421715 RepID=A0AAN7QHT1_9COLE|nr:hypothetical protein RN001_010879 [Aquatica leii]